MHHVNLRTRFIAAHVLTVIVLSVAFSLTVGVLIEAYEHDLLNRQVKVGLEHFAADWADNHALQPPNLAGTRILVVAPEQLAHLPRQMQTISPGVHDDIKIDGNGYFVGRKDVGDTRIYLLLDANPIEVMEARMQRYAISGLLIGIILSVLVALWLSGQVMKPLVELSHWVRRLRPEEPFEPFGHQYRDRIIDGMVATVEGYADRIARFVAREQAFTEDVSHELRTPLTVARNTVTLLLEDATLSPSARLRIERLDRATRQMQELVEAILFLAREDGGGGTVLIDLNELVQDVVDSRAEAAEAARVSVVINGSGPQQVDAHPGMVMSIIGNLLDNAIRHGGAGTVLVTLTPGCLQICDEGPGMAPDQEQALMGRGVRGAHSVGHGLGLHIVQGLCTRLDWAMTVASSPQSGTCIRIAFVPAQLTPR